ncbi:MAG: hypothetical protein AAF627_02800 [Myxococcota bacterium]
MTMLWSGCNLKVMALMLLAITSSCDLEAERREREAQQTRAIVESQLRAQVDIQGRHLQASVGAVLTGTTTFVPGIQTTIVTDSDGDETFTVTPGGPSWDPTIEDGTEECGTGIFFVEVPLENTPLTMTAAQMTAVEDALKEYVLSVANPLLQPEPMVWFDRPEPLYIPVVNDGPHFEVPDVSFTRVLPRRNGSDIVTPLRADGHDRAFRLTFHYPPRTTPQPHFMITFPFSPVISQPASVADIAQSAVGPITWKLRNVLRSVLGLSQGAFQARYRVGSECTFRGLQSGSHPLGVERVEWHKRAMGMGMVEGAIPNLDQARIALIDSGVSGRLDPFYQVGQGSSHLTVVPGVVESPSFHPHGASLVKIIRSVAPLIEIKSYRVMDEQGLGNTAALAAGMDAAMQDAVGPGNDGKPTVINLSLGWPQEHTHLTSEKHKLRYEDPLTASAGTTMNDGVGEVVRYMLKVIEEAEKTLNRPPLVVVAAAGNRSRPAGQGLGSTTLTSAKNLEAFGAPPRPFMYLPPHYRSANMRFSGLPRSMRYDPIQNAIIGFPPPGPIDFEIRRFRPEGLRPLIDQIKIVQRLREGPCSFAAYSRPHSWFYPAAYQGTRSCASEDLAIVVGGIADDLKKAVLTPHDVEPDVVAPSQWVFAERNESFDVACQYIPDPVTKKAFLPLSCYPKLVSGTSVAAVLVSTAIALRQARFMDRGMSPERRGRLRQAIGNLGIIAPRTGIPAIKSPRIPHIPRLTENVTTEPDPNPDLVRGGPVDGTLQAGTPKLGISASVRSTVPPGGPDRYSLGIIGPKPDVPLCPSCFAVPGTTAIQVYLQLEPSLVFDFSGSNSPALPRIRVEGIAGPGGPVYFDLQLPPGWSGPLQPFWQDIQIDPAQCTNCEFRLEAGIQDIGSSAWSWEIGPIQRTF